MKFAKKLIPVAVVVLMFLFTCLSALAATYDASGQVVYLASGQLWTKGYGATHDGAYSKVGAMCHSVYPISGSDNFSKIQCKVTNTLDEVIATKPYVTLSEGAKDYTVITLDEGNISTPTVYFHFRGNTDEQAQAVVSYIGTYIS
jgi:hypothetical protein